MEKRLTHISVYEHERAMFQLNSDHISSIHRSRLCRTNCHFHTVHCAINLPVSRSDFKAHANKRWYLMGYQQRNVAVLSPVYTGLKKNYFFHNEHHRWFVDGWENSSPLRGILKPVIRRREDIMGFTARIEFSCIGISTARTGWIRA